MNFKDLHPPILEIPAHQTWHRVQRTSARRDSVRFKGYVLAPPGGLAGRFDLADEPTAYLADSPETALYESLFRREVRSCHWDRLDQRSVVSFDARASLRLADLRGLEERYPVLHPCVTRPAKSLRKTAGSKNCTASCTHRPSIRTIIACVCSSLAWNGPKKWLPLHWWMRAAGRCTRRS